MTSVPTYVAIAHGDFYLTAGDHGITTFSDEGLQPGSIWERTVVLTTASGCDRVTLRNLRGEYLQVDQGASRWTASSVKPREEYLWRFTEVWATDRSWLALQAGGSGDYLTKRDGDAAPAASWALGVRQRLSYADVPDWLPDLAAYRYNRKKAIEDITRFGENIEKEGVVVPVDHVKRLKPGG